MISTKTSLTGLIQLAYFSLYLFVSYELSVLILVYRVFKVKRNEWGLLLVDFYDGGDHVHMWGLKFRKDEHIWVWGFEDWKKYLGSKIDGKLTYLGSEILRANKVFIWGLEFGVSLIL